MRRANLSESSPCLTSRRWEGGSSLHGWSCDRWTNLASRPASPTMTLPLTSQLVKIHLPCGTWNDECFHDGVEERVAQPAPLHCHHCGNDPCLVCGNPLLGPSHGLLAWHGRRRA